MTPLVNEIFETIQGEARWTGTPAVFVRLQGCPVGCAWCDTKHTWDTKPEDKVEVPIMFNKTIDSTQYAEMTVERLMEALDAFKSGHVVITGGEPCLYDLTSLTTAIIESGRTCQIETSGTHKVLAHRETWITVSPKLDMPGGLKVREDVIAMADEIKHPVGKIGDVEKLQKEVIPWVSQYAEVWLQPLSQSAKATALCVEQATEHGYRVSIQTHKFIGVR